MGTSAQACHSARLEAVEAKIEKMLSKMTLDEKIGQMLELNFDIMGTYDANGQWQLAEQADARHDYQGIGKNWAAS